LSRAPVHARADTLPAGLVARHPPALHTELGFTQVSVEGHTAVLTELDLAEPLLNSIAGAGALRGDGNRAAAGALWPGRCPSTRQVAA
jgi:hypothetical protein